jgi:uncharacterized protein YfiM (DUF2279 family)
MNATKTTAARLTNAAGQKFAGAQAIYSAKSDPKYGPGWSLRFASGRTQWIGRNAAEAAEWIENR